MKLFGGYQPIDTGLKEIGGSDQVQEWCMQAAARGRSFAASADPSGEYSVDPAPVTIGWKNEVRAGAKLLNTAKNAWRNERKMHTLNRAVDVIESY